MENVVTARWRTRVLMVCLPYGSSPETVLWFLSVIVSDAILSGSSCGQGDGTSLIIRDFSSALPRSSPRTCSCENFSMLPYRPMQKLALP